MLPESLSIFLKVMGICGGITLLGMWLGTCKGPNISPADRWSIEYKKCIEYKHVTPLIVQRCSELAEAVVKESP